MGIQMEFQVYEEVDKVISQIDNSMRDKLLEAVDLVRNEVEETLTGDRHGRMYFVPGTRQDYIASAPGEAPASRLGDLRRSVKGGLEMYRGMLTGFVGSDLDYAPLLEFGTVRMEPRPWLGPSFDRCAGDIKRMWTKRWFV